MQNGLYPLFRDIGHSLMGRRKQRIYTKFDWNGEGDIPLGNDSSLGQNFKISFANDAELWGHPNCWPRQTMTKTVENQPF